MLALKIYAEALKLPMLEKMEDLSAHSPVEPMVQLIPGPLATPTMVLALSIGGQLSAEVGDRASDARVEHFVLELAQED
eukprot:CAMPEP_0204205892 /NCGR_PEP_ID=MMETSP0361-20130328/70661_1 /ASSEMBLY_ACC=CAM_ASM_000343 /TAXON_ID=268821 /ORGANISM="Scrippsiella Hangoei, Strain SHTV-5" /LENGTH=78 /DNA_ID=CAMNT_0051169221 /DNA_START=75 /DNA_END=311 /DNA_ORIENTATION=-